MNTKRAYNSKTSPVSAGQIKKLHSLANAMGWDDEQYRDNMHTQTGKSTSLKLTFNQADALLNDWERKAVAAGVWKTKTNPSRPPFTKGGANKTKYADLDGRPGFATGGQCRLIDAMWSQVSFTEVGEARESALNHFIKRISGVDGLRFLKRRQVEKVVKAIEAMGAEHKNKGDKS